MRSVDDKTRDSYVAMRNSGNYDAAWFYRYFLENGGKDTGIDYFISVLNLLIVKLLNKPKKNFIDRYQTHTNQVTLMGSIRLR
jgi:hypothetical protein